VVYACGLGRTQFLSGADGDRTECGGHSEAERSEGLPGRDGDQSRQHPVRGRDPGSAGLYHINLVLRTIRARTRDPRWRLRDQSSPAGLKWRCSEEGRNFMPLGRVKYFGCQKQWAGQSCLQPPFRRLLARRVIVLGIPAKRRLKAGCKPGMRPTALESVEEYVDVLTASELQWVLWRRERCAWRRRRPRPAELYRRGRNQGAVEPGSTASAPSTRPWAIAYIWRAFPILAGGRIVIPVGSHVAGTVTEDQEAGRVKGRGELYVRPSTR